jgi:hypothetical protein
MGLAALLFASAACEGPQLRILNPEQHHVFLDGRRMRNDLPEVDELGNVATPAPGTTPPSDVALDPKPALDPNAALDPEEAPGPEGAANLAAEPEPSSLGTSRTVKFRYYGTSRLDTMPLVREEHGVPQFEHVPSSEWIEIPEPVSPWLFPIDFPLEVLGRAFTGRSDQTVTVTPTQKPAEQRIDLEIPQEELGKLSARGRQARIIR